jgi:hypothetical protein
MNINDILKPKTKEEIRKCLEECDDASEQLLGYLRINHNIDHTLGTRWLMESTNKEFDKLGRKFKNTGASQEVIAKYIFNHTNWNKFKKPCLKITENGIYNELDLYTCDGRWHHEVFVKCKKSLYLLGFNDENKIRIECFLNKYKLKPRNVRIKYDFK